MINQFYIDYIKAIENPDRIGWNGKVWIAPQYKGYDKNQRGYGIDIVKNDSARRLTQNRPGQWLTEEEADKLMKEHLQYVYGAAQKHIEGFDNLSDRRKAALLGMLYRGDSVNENRHIININEPDDNKFFESISNYYKSKGLNERARNSSKFFNNNNQQQTNFQIPMKWEQWEPPMKFKSGGQVRIKTAYKKQGGKMNILEFLKNGSGIHIKEKNKGSFTRWCGGNVTEECIRRGKNSSNPKIRRKATFADNARKWKHEKGGCFKGYPSKAAYDVRLEEVAGFKKGGKAFVEGVNVLDSNPDAYKHLKKKVKMRSYGGPLEYLFKEAQYQNWVNDYLNPTVINYNPDIDANRNFKFNNSIQQQTDEYNNQKQQEAERINNEAQRYGSFLSKGLEQLFGYLNKPKAVSNNSTNFNTDSWSKVNKDLAGTSYIKPDTNNKQFTSNVIGSNMNVTYDDMRNLK